MVEPTPLKNMLVNMGIFPNFRGEHKKYLSCHHLGKFLREVMLIFLLKTLKIPLLRDLMDDSCRKALAVWRFVSFPQRISTDPNVFKAQRRDVGFREATSFQSFKDTIWRLQESYGRLCSFIMSPFKIQRTSLNWRFSILFG